MGSSASVPTTVFFEGYRIPALLHIPNSNILLAFAEKRDGKNDEDATILYMRKVENHKSELEQIRNNKNAARLCYVTSADHGQIWSDHKDLTDDSKLNINTWATFALGPGHGIQLSNGRLIIPASAHVKELDEQVRVRAFTFFSDDHGKSWQLGRFVSGEECGECQVAMVHEYKVSSSKCGKVCNDKQALIYCNARSNKVGYRVEAFSRDGGKTFTVGKLMEHLVEPPEGCHGSVISFPSSVVSCVKNYSKVEKYHHGQVNNSQEFDIILFSHTTSSESRNDLGIYLATYSGNSPSWTHPWVIGAGECGYSDLAFIKLPRKTNPIVACLFEQGSTNENISFCLLQIDDIIENTIKRSADGNTDSDKVKI